MADILARIPDAARTMVRIDNGSVLPSFVSDKSLKDIYNLKIRDSDVTIVTWPKSGTSWSQYIVSQIIHGTEFVKENNLFRQHIFLEHPQKYEDINSDGCYKQADEVPSPRFLKSHMLMRYLPREMLAKKTKVIYVARNPKDAAVSYYHFCLANKLLPIYRWNDFFEGLCEGLLPYGDWFEHVLPWWEKRNEPHVLFLKYEDMKMNLRKVVVQLSTFLERPLTDEQVTEITEGSSFENMKENPNANLDKLSSTWQKEEGKHIKFMRKGIIGDWKNFFTVAQSEKFDKIYQRKMAGTGLVFTF